MYCRGLLGFVAVVTLILLQSGVNAGSSGRSLRRLMAHSDTSTVQPRLNSIIQKHLPASGSASSSAASTAPSSSQASSSVACQHASIGALSGLQLDSIELTKGDVSGSDCSQAYNAAWKDFLAPAASKLVNSAKDAALWVDQKLHHLHEALASDDASRGSSSQGITAQSAVLVDPAAAADSSAILPDSWILSEGYPVRDYAPALEQEQTHQHQQYLQQGQQQQGQQQQGQQQQQQPGADLVQLRQEVEAMVSDTLAYLTKFEAARGGSGRRMLRL